MEIYIKRFQKGNVALGALAVAILIVGLVVCWSGTGYAAPAEETDTTGRATVQTGNPGLAFIAAALAVGLSAVAAGIAMGMSNVAAIGAISERPELLGRLLLFVGLAEGIAIYGLVIGIMILTKV